jgi:hypothetical protein
MRLQMLKCASGQKRHPSAGGDSLGSLEVAYLEVAYLEVAYLVQAC